MKSNKLTALVKTVPSTLQESVKFPTNQEQKNKITYNVVSVGSLEAGQHNDVILSAKIVSHLPKE